ncbi:hypothetical protein [Methylomagnum sp.]
MIEIDLGRDFLNRAWQSHCPACSQRPAIIQNPKKFKTADGCLVFENKGKMWDGRMKISSLAVPSISGQPKPLNPGPAPGIVDWMLNNI